MNLGTSSYMPAGRVNSKFTLKRVLRYTPRRCRKLRGKLVFSNGFCRNSIDYRKWCHCWKSSHECLFVLLFVHHWFRLPGYHSLDVVWNRLVGESASFFWSTARCCVYGLCGIRNRPLYWWYCSSRRMCSHGTAIGPFSRSGRSSQITRNSRSLSAFYSFGRLYLDAWIFCLQRRIGIGHCQEGVILFDMSTFRCAKTFHIKTLAKLRRKCCGRAWCRLCHGCYEYNDFWFGWWSDSTSSYLHEATPLWWSTILECPQYSQWRLGWYGHCLCWMQ